tara:strand:- start:3 stop:239 length:237 start_codon:yes stop_codon:yes gene_type:complete
MTKFSSPFLAKSPIKQDTFGGTPDSTEDQKAYEEATGQLYNEGKITESNEEGHKKILQRIEENKRKKLAASHRGISGA